ncbi:DUF4352 domain-containing protein [Sporosarcina sp. USHLN248]|uniref:DUF4352 domain-containing protein n=1 Tax=Sporosarcina sp. USHLN248 TaxID=3081300 RepID=UPI0038B54C12
MSEKVKKPFYKKWWVWLIAVILLIAIVNPGSDEAESQEKAETSGPATKNDSKGDGNKKETAEEKKKEKVEKEEKKKDEPKSFAIGDTVNVGKMVYRVNEKSVANQVGPKVLPQKASGQYVVIDVTLKNDGNEAVTVDSSFFKLKRGEKTYEADTMGSMSANQSDDGNIDNSFFLQSLNPDSEITGKVVFDVAPEVAESNDLQLQVQTGFWGTETEIIDLK